MDCILWTGFHTGTASYTFRMIWSLTDIDIHFACTCTQTASDTFTVFDLDVEKGYFIKKLINCTKGTKPFAKRSVKQNT